MTARAPHGLAPLAVLLLGVLLAPSALADPPFRERTGVAYERGSERVLYTEVHRERVEGSRVVEDRVTYRGPDGEVFAFKSVDFRVSELAPGFVLEDRRTGYLEALEGRPPARIVRVREAGERGARQARIGGDGGLVADAGFDRFIENHWRALLAGEVLRRRFLVPSRLEAIDVRIRHTGSAAGGETFALEIDSALLRLVAPSVRVRYDSRSRQLVHYEGPSNIRGADGANLDVRIEFAPSRRAGAPGPGAAAARLGD